MVHRRRRPDSISSLTHTRDKGERFSSRPTPRSGGQRRAFCGVGPERFAHLQKCGYLNPPWVQIARRYRRKDTKLTGRPQTLFAIAESCPFDALLVRDMKRAVNALVQLNLKRFRVPQKSLAKYSALDVIKQALELLFEFSPSEKNYREAMRTIRVYSEGDEEMARTMTESFRLIANAVYNAYSGQRHAESLAPEILFLEGIPFEPAELQQSFRFVGVRPPEIAPPSVKRTVFLDENFAPYKMLLEGKISGAEAQIGREEYWAKGISAELRDNETAVMRAGVEHVIPRKSPMAKMFAKIRRGETGRLPGLLNQEGISIELVYQSLDVNKIYGK
jgi:hypothetical protein